MVSLRESVGEEVSNCIVDNAKFLLKHYLGLKSQFKNIGFWGEDAYHQWDSDISRLEKLVEDYK